MQCSTPTLRRHTGLGDRPPLALCPPLVKGLTHCHMSLTMELEQRWRPFKHKGALLVKCSREGRGTTAEMEATRCAGVDRS